MGIGYKPQIAAPNLADNTSRWDGMSPGHYEVWFLTLNHRASQRGFWFRYLIDVPAANLDREPQFEVWAGVFDRPRSHENFVIREETCLETNEIDAPPDLVLRFNNGSLSSTRSKGEVEAGGHQVKWDLSFVPNHETYHHVSPTMLHMVKPSSFVLSPNLNAKFTGTITVDGCEIYLQDEPGCQSHLWGTKHVDDWVWAHSNAFEKHPDTVFEGLAARPRRGGRTFPPIYSLLLRHRGEQHRFVRLRFAEQWQRRLGMGYWSFKAFDHRLRIDGVAQCRLRDMLQVEYIDPDGEPLYCINSEVGNLKVRLFRRIHGIRWRHVETISAIGTAHLEHASRRIDPNVRMAFPPKAISINT
jgi:hypothetical protein